MFAFSAARIESPARVTGNQPSAWHEAGPGADLVIITHADFLGSVGPLKALREGQGLSVAVVDVEDVYDEFSFGATSAWAIRDFLQRARSEWQRPPRYVLLVGDASLDPRNYLGFGDFNFVPTKLVDTRLMETASDGWLSDFDGDGVPEMAIGRLPVRTAAEADAVVAKIVGYAQAGNPGGEALMVADRNDVADSSVVFDFEAASTALEQFLPANLTVREIFRGQMGDSAARSDLLARLNAGPLLVHYFGHGSVGVWRGDLLESSDAEALTNGSRLPLLIAMTCLNGYFHDPSVEGLAESLLTANQGGAVAVWASSGMTAPEGQLAMSRALVPLLFGGLTVGDAAVQAKAAVEDRDVRVTWMLFGDPLTKLK
jgi:hypothetical protein